MNFISHFYLDRHRQEDLFAIGLVTPDLVSVFQPEFRLKPYHLKQSEFHLEEHPENLFLEGIKRHFWGDRYFHSAYFFEVETAFLSNQLRNRFMEESIPRKFFISHILLELLLDKVILMDHPEVLEEFYGHFETADPERVSAMTAELMGHELPGYVDFLVEFKREKWLRNYLVEGHVARIIRSIMKTVGINETAFTENPDFLAFLTEYEKRLTKIYPTVFNLLKKQEKE